MNNISTFKFINSINRKCICTGISIKKQNEIK